MRVWLPLSLLSLGVFFLILPAQSAPVKGAVAADHPLASEVGASVLKAGGNAVDAAIATVLALGVVQPTGSGLGGGGFALVVQKGKATVLDFRETAPAAATREMFLQGASSTKGGLAVAVPSEAFGLVELHRRFGRLDWVKVVMPAINLAKKGFTPGDHLKKGLLATPGMSMLFGENYQRLPLEKALRSLATSEGEHFRRGWVAEDIVAAVQAAGGILTKADLENYKVEERSALVGHYEGYTVWTMPSPSSGGTALLELLGATEGVSRVHCEVEAAKHAMARRALTGGDGVSNTIDPARIAAIRADCGDHTFAPDHYGAMITPAVDGGTAHISVIDGEGLAVALTTTINTSFGSEVVAPRSGILLNNEMDDFTTKPGQPNAFGLVQSEANAIVPGHRPLSSMTPTILMDASGQNMISVGGSGGPFIITETYQALRNVLDHAMGAQAAVAAPRWHHQWQPNVLLIDTDHPARLELREAGHELKDAPDFPAAQIVVLKNGTFDAGADPRKGGLPAIVQ